jgi:transposase
MKSIEEVMQILEAYDVTESFEAAARLSGCDAKTVARYVMRRDEGVPADAAPARDSVIDPHLDKIEEWVERSQGDIRADVVHRKLVAMDYRGSERTTRRAVAAAKGAYRRGHRRVFRPWVPEPGLWLQWDWGAGPRIWGRDTHLFCAWLAWSRYRVIIPTWDKTLATVVACIDSMLREFEGVPTYALTDNEKTVTTEHVCSIAVRHPDIVAVSRHYGMTIHTCVPADPQSKGGSEATVRIAKADLVPTTANLLDNYDSFSELEAASRAAMVRFNSREHRETRRVPAEMIAHERARLHRVPDVAHTLAFGQCRTVDERDSTIRFGSARYSVPHTLMGERVWVRVSGDELVVVDASPRGAREVARHKLTTPGNPSIVDDHYPQRTTDPLNPRPRPQTEDERAFLVIGEGAHQWLIEAAACGAQRVRTKMAEAAELAALVGAELVDRALGLAATSGRFASSDLHSIVDHLSHQDPVQRELRLPDAGSTLQRGTRTWEGFGR